VSFRAAQQLGARGTGATSAEREGGSPTGRAIRYCYCDCGGQQTAKRIKKAAVLAYKKVAVVPYYRCRASLAIQGGGLTPLLPGAL
jgi:hypothetical protein